MALFSLILWSYRLRRHLALWLWSFEPPPPAALGPLNRLPRRRLALWAATRQRHKQQQWIGSSLYCRRITKNIFLHSSILLGSVRKMWEKTCYCIAEKCLKCHFANPNEGPQYLLSVSTSHRLFSRRQRHGEGPRRRVTLRASAVTRTNVIATGTRKMEISCGYTVTVAPWLIIRNLSQCIQWQ